MLAFSDAPSLRIFGIPPSEDGPTDSYKSCWTEQIDFHPQTGMLPLVQHSQDLGEESLPCSKGVRDSLPSYCIA